MGSVALEQVALDLRSDHGVAFTPREIGDRAPDALAALRHEWYPDGIAARRDALILVLTAHGFTRNRIRRLQPSDITTFPAPVVDGLDLPEHPNPALCARCALTRWLAILDAYRDRARRDIEESLPTPATPPPEPGTTAATTSATGGTPRRRSSPRSTGTAR